MVLIAASVFTKTGKALVARNFIADMTKARLEGLLDAFPKLVTLDKNQRQHTFVETDSVRYVYQPLDNIYIVLITTKASNILEDLETLRLFARVIPEYCRSNEESEILLKAHDLIFAFDEIVVLGYRENVNLAQIRTFTEMDSHEERVHNQMQQAQQKAALSLMKEKEKEIKRQEKLKRHMKAGMGVASATGISSAQARAELTSAIKESVTAAAASGGGFSSSSGNGTVFGGAGGKKTTTGLAAGGGKALKLGAKANTNDEAFLQQLRTEGERIADKDSTLAVGGGAQAGGDITAGGGSTVPSRTGPVHLRCMEKLNASLSRVGAVNSAEIQGSISLCVTEAQYNTVAVHIQNQVEQMPGYDKNKKAAQIQVHPNLDKKAWQSASVLRLKSEQKPFPVGVDVGVLKWTVQLPNEDSLPISFNCFPNENPNGCVVNIEYTLQREDLQLRNVQITIPLPPATAPVVTECEEGAYEYQRSKSQLLWTLPLVDQSNPNGTFEFSTPNGNSDHFFPVNVRFTSTDPCCKITIAKVEQKTGDSIEFTSEQALINEKYEIS